MPRVAQSRLREELSRMHVIGKTPRPAETTTRHWQPGGEGHTFGADSESEFLGLQVKGFNTRSLAR